MRIGVISDIHGNVAGLGRALERMGDVDELLCAGDVVEQFRFSNEAVALLRERGARCVLGNHDLVLLSPHGERARSAAHIDPDLVQWLAEQPTSLELDVDGKRLLLTHASPFAPYTEYIYPHSPDLQRMQGLDGGNRERVAAAEEQTRQVLNPAQREKYEQLLARPTMHFLYLRTSTTRPAH